MSINHFIFTFVFGSRPGLGEVDDGRHVRLDRPGGRHQRVRRMFFFDLEQYSGDKMASARDATRFLFAFLWFTSESISRI